MIEHAVFYDRLNNHCKPCQWWQGVCLRGHSLASASGCPVRKFPPVAGADYATDHEPAPVPVPQVGCCGQGAPPVTTWAAVAKQFAEAMVKWVREGMSLVDPSVHQAQYGICKTCDRFKDFYCQECKCIAYLKAKLATETCPLDRWPKNKSQNLTDP